MMMYSRKELLFLLFVPAIVINGFNLPRNQISLRTLDRQLHHRNELYTSHIKDECGLVEAHNNDMFCFNLSERYNRRDILVASLNLSVLTMLFHPEHASATSDDVSLGTIVAEIKKARKQMDAVPDLIKSEQWDGVRAILITPPLSDLWTKSGRKSPLLQDYANVVGATPSGDELAVLEGKEDVEGHLRFLDMAVYNNNFNPIKSVGEIGATKALISSYYEDPINEYKATIAALDNLIQLGNVN